MESNTTSNMTMVDGNDPSVQAAIEEMISHNQDDIAKHQLTIKEAKESVKLYEALKRLDSNPDFKKVFLEGYFKAESHRLTMLLSYIEPKNPEQRDAAIRDLDAISVTHRYLEIIAHNGMGAKQAIEDSQHAQVELSKENESIANGSFDLYN